MNLNQEIKIISIFRRSLRCVRNTIHTNLFVALMCNSVAWIVWYHGVSEPAGTCGLDDAVSDCPTLVAGGVVIGACNNASVVAGPFEDCLAEDGIVYMIDEVLLPPALCNGTVVQATLL